MEELSSEQQAYVLQFQHPKKILAGMPGMSDATVAAIFGIAVEVYRRLRAGFAKRALQAAHDLLADAEFADRVDRLPFQPGDTVVGLGDSITDDDQSWLEILRALVQVRRPQDHILVVNAGISGDTTSQMISRFLDVVVQKPDWIICMAGTNDARRHGRWPTKVLVSFEETKKNLDMLRNFAATQTSAQRVWMTPTPVIEEQIARDWFLGPRQLMWSNEDLAVIASAVCDQPDLVVDLWTAFGTPPDPRLLLPDGLHPSLAGQTTIVSALVDRLATR